MASANVEISGSDVLDALTSTKWHDELNTYGEELANLIAKRVVQIVRAKLAKDLIEEESE